MAFVPELISSGYYSATNLMNKKIIAGLISLGVIGSTVGMFVYHKSNIQKTINKPIAVVENYNVSNLEYYYFYWTQVAQFNTTYAETLNSMLIDTSIDYHMQTLSSPTEDGLQTWGDVVDKMTFEYINRINKLVEQADKNGFKSDAIDSIYNNKINDLKKEAQKNGYTLDQYITLRYMDEVTLEDLKPIIKKESKATAYKNYLAQDVVVTDEEIEEYYQNNKDDYDYFNYRRFSIDYTAFIDKDKVTEGEDGENVVSQETFNEAKEAALNKANEMISQITSEEDFLNAYIDYYKEYVSNKMDTEMFLEEDPLKHTNVLKMAIIDEIQEWMFSEDRQEGDCNVVFNETKQTYEVYYYIGRERMSRTSIDARIIYLPYPIKVENQYKVSETAKQETRQQAEDIIKEFETDKTEEHFASLAQQYSKDINAKDKGGLWTNIAAYSLNSNITNWLFDAIRVNGDYTYIEEDNGIEIIYFISQKDDTTWYGNIKSELEDDKIIDFLGNSYNEEISYEFLS